MTEILKQSALDSSGRINKIRTPQHPFLIDVKLLILRENQIHELVEREEVVFISVSAEKQGSCFISVDFKSHFVDHVVDIGCVYVSF